MDGLKEMEGRDGRIVDGGLILGLADGAAAAAARTTRKTAEITSELNPEPTAEIWRAEIATKAARLAPLLERLSPIERMTKTSRVNLWTHRVYDQLRY